MYIRLFRKLHCLNLVKSDLGIKILNLKYPFFEYTIPSIWKHPEKTFSCMLSSHQDRIVELCAHKIDISDSKLFYYIKLRKIGNLGLDQQF